MFISQLRQDLREMFTEQVEYRELFWQMTKRDLLLRYKQTVMGFAWAIFTPLVNTLVYSVIFTRVAPIDVGIPYPLFAFTGLLAWNFFATSLKFAGHLSVEQCGSGLQGLLPTRSLPGVARSSWDLSTRSSPARVVLGLMAWYGVVPSVQVLWLPMVLAVHVLLTVAAALLLSMANLFYRDVKYLTDVVMSVAVFTTSALYPVESPWWTRGSGGRLEPAVSRSSTGTATCSFSTARL